MDNSQIVAKRIKETAGAQNIKLGQMFKDLKISVNTLHNMKTYMPSVETLSNIADYLGCSLDDLLGRENKNAPDKVRSMIIKRVLALSDKQALALLAFLESQVAE